MAKMKLLGWTLHSLETGDLYCVQWVKWYVQTYTYVMNYEARKTSMALIFISPHTRNLMWKSNQQMIIINMQNNPANLTWTWRNWVQSAKLINCYDYALLYNVWHSSLGTQFIVEFLNQATDRKLKSWVPGLSTSERNQCSTKSLFSARPFLKSDFDSYIEFLLTIY